MIDLMNFSVVVPTRGNDRKKMLEHCKLQISKQTVQPNEILIIDYEPTGTAIDLVDRVKEGIKKSGFEYVAIMEDDDYYHPDYLKWMMSIVAREHTKGYQLFGIGETYYYHVPVRKYMRMVHKHSSLFCTVIKNDKNLKFPDKLNNPFLDIYLWQHNSGVTSLFDGAPMCIGIKGMSGSKFCGRGHIKDFPYKNEDPNHSWLKQNTVEQSFQFYTTYNEN